MEQNGIWKLGLLEGLLDKCSLFVKLLSGPRRIFVRRFAPPRPLAHALILLLVGCDFSKLRLGLGALDWQFKGCVSPVPERLVLNVSRNQ